MAALHRIALPALLAAATCLSGTGAAAAADAPRLVLPLTVVGNAVVDGNGQPVTLRGLQRDGTQGGPGVTNAPVTTDEIRWMTRGRTGSWNAAVVRVPVGSAQWTGACPNLANDPAGYRASVDREVADINAGGALALIDLHTSTAGCTAIGAHAMPDAPVAQQFWSDVAAHYRDNPLVAFELYNEPHYVTDSVWLHGTSSATQQDCDSAAPTTAKALAVQSLCRSRAPRYQAVGMQELYDLVTAAAPGHLVVVDGPGYAGAAPTLRVTATRGQLVYAVHPYTCSIPGSTCDTTENARANLAVLRSWQPLAAEHPVLASELGWPVHPVNDGVSYVDGARYYTETLAFLAAQRPAWGFVAFAFDGSTSGAFSLVGSTDTYLPNSTGVPVLAALRLQP